jgi:hypothetical protein
MITSRAAEWSEMFDTMADYGRKHGIYGTLRDEPAASPEVGDDIMLLLYIVVCVILPSFPF